MLYYTRYSTYCLEQESDQKKSVKCYVLDDTVYNEYSSTWGAAEDDLSSSSTGWPAASSLCKHRNVLCCVFPCMN